MKTASRPTKVKLIKEAHLFKSKVLEGLNAALRGETVARKHPMYSVLITDAAVYINYCDAILRGSYNLAATIQYDMDSFPRDDIPLYLYNTIQRLTST